LRASPVPYLVGALVVCGLTALATWEFTLERGALWQVVRACVADQRLTGSPFPCLEVDLTGGEEQGYVVLRQPFPRDTILAPTRKIIGVEDPFLYSPEAPNYFDAAWRARTFLHGADGKPPERDRIALAVNSRVARHQDQLHIHIGCLVPSARNAVRAIAPRLRVGEWAQVGAVVPHSMFWGLRIQGDLAAAQPFRLAGDYLADKARNRADIMIVVAATRVAGDDEFLILASYAHAPHSWWVFGAEDLLDPSCSTASDLPGEAAPGRQIGGAAGRQAAASERRALTLLR
jgi:CDP-diacylglycerol pyrophosphatase